MHTSRNSAYVVKGTTDLRISIKIGYVTEMTGPNIEQKCLQTKKSKEMLIFKYQNKIAKVL